VDQLSPSISGQRSERVPLSEAASKGFLDRVWAVNKFGFWREDGDLDSVARERAHGKGRFESRHSPASDQNLEPLRLAALGVGFTWLGHLTPPRCLGR
jgi:hypothetical protein